MSQHIDASAQVAPGEDWRTAMLRSAEQAAETVSVRERSKNPAIPNNFLDVSEAGFPSDIVVKAVQIPHPGVAGEMSQYQDMRNRQWLHVPWEFISKNGGLDGRAFVPGAERVDLGGGFHVAALAGHYLMYANRKQYEQRRARISERANESRAYKLNNEEQTDNGVRKTQNVGPGQMTVEELLEFEQRIGPEPALTGQRIDS